MNQLNSYAQLIFWLSTQRSIKETLILDIETWHILKRGKLRVQGMENFIKIDIVLEERY